MLLATHRDRYFCTTSRPQPLCHNYCTACSRNMSRLGLVSDGTSYYTACAAVCTGTRQDGERNVLKFSRSVGLHCRKGPRWPFGPFPLIHNLIVTNMKGCVRGLAVPISRLRSNLRLRFLLLSANRLAVLLDSPIDKSRLASVLLPATLTTSCLEDPSLAWKPQGPNPDFQVLKV